MCWFCVKCATRTWLIIAFHSIPTKFKSSIQISGFPDGMHELPQLTHFCLVFFFPSFLWFNPARQWNENTLVVLHQHQCTVGSGAPCLHVWRVQETQYCRSQKCRLLAGNGSFTFNKELISSTKCCLFFKWSAHIDHLLFTVWGFFFPCGDLFLKLKWNLNVHHR